MARWIGIVMIVLVGLSGAVGSSQAEPTDDEGTVEQVRAAMQEYFVKRLRTELGLSDEAVRAIVPRVEGLEAAKVEARRERLETAMRLRRGMHRGASDAELQRLLDRLDGVEWKLRERERETLAEIDALLTVRQRVQLRFFMPEFRRELQQRIGQLRGDDRGGRTERPWRQRGPRTRGR